MVDKLLFEYLTRRAGLDLDDVAKALNMHRSQLSRRLDGTIQFRLDEMQAWAELVGCGPNVGPVFFPRIYTYQGTLPPEAVATAIPGA